MKKTKFYLGAMALMLAGSLVSCSADDPIDGNDVGAQEVVDNGEKVYMAVSVQLPVGGSGARSATDEPKDDYSTSSDKIEIGKEYENKVSNMLIVLARKSDNGYIAYGEVSETSKLSESSDKTTLRATSKFSKTDIASYYSKIGNGFEQDIHLFVICNYTKDLSDMFKAGVAPLSNGWLDKVCEVYVSNPSKTEANTEIWKKNNILMTNAVIASKKLPESLKDWDAYTSENTPLNLSIDVTTPAGEFLANNGAVRVERAVARFDFRDGSDLGNNTYHVVASVLGDDPNADPTNIVDVKLNRMALVNMSNKFYYFRRVTPGGICMPEQPWGITGVTGNYVEDVDFATKQAGYDAFNYPLFNGNKIDETARNQWYNVLISDVLGKENDEYGGKKYHIWRYVTENTVDRVARMKDGLSTGVVFKGKMIPTEAALNSADESVKHLANVLAYDKTKVPELKEDINEDPILYTFGGNLYVTWENVRKAAIKSATTDEVLIKTNAFYEAVFGDGDYTEENGSTDETSPDHYWHVWNKAGKPSDGTMLQDFKKAATSNGITIYQSSLDDNDGWGYYCYYFYWNRHNDNGNNGVIGDMEFAVVRNNVYKLAVTNINRLGHPRLSDNDPDPENPDKPDESGDVYMTLSVEVIPWTVRVNNIEF